MKLQSIQGPQGESYPFLDHIGPWRVGDRVAYTAEYCKLARTRTERVARRRWKGVILSCTCGGTMPSSFLVFEGAPLFETWAQHPHYLRKLGR